MIATLAMNENPKKLIGIEHREKEKNI